MTVAGADRPVRLRRDEAEQWVRQLFERVGVDADTARQVAVALVEAELEGSASHGLLQGPTYGRGIITLPPQLAASLNALSREPGGMALAAPEN